MKRAVTRTWSWKAIRCDGWCDSGEKYHQRSKVATIFFVIKRTTGDDVRSIRTKGQNNETRLEITSYNAARIASRVYSLFVGFLQGQQREL